MSAADNLCKRRVVALCGGIGGAKLVLPGVAGIESLLAEDARTITDAGGEYNALRVPIAGRSKVAVFHLRVTQRRGPAARVALRMVNGLTAVVIEFAESHRRAVPRVVLRCQLDHEGRSREIQSLLAPRKLTGIGRLRD